MGYPARRCSEGGAWFHVGGAAAVLPGLAKSGGGVRFRGALLRRALQDRWPGRSPPRAERGASAPQARCGGPPGRRGFARAFGRYQKSDIRNQTREDKGGGQQGLAVKAEGCGNGDREFRRARTPFCFPHALIERSIFYSSNIYYLKGYSLAVSKPCNASEKISDSCS